MPTPLSSDQSAYLSQGEIIRDQFIRWATGNTRDVSPEVAEGAGEQCLRVWQMVAAEVARTAAEREARRVGERA